MIFSCFMAPAPFSITRDADSLKSFANLLMRAFAEIFKRFPALMPPPAEAYGAANR